MPVVGGQDGYGGEGPPPCPGRKRACLRVSSVNMNGLSVLEKEKLVESSGRRLKVIGIQETYPKGCGVVDCVLGSESEV